MRSPVLCSIVMPPEQTGALIAGNYRDEIQVTTQGGEVSTQAVGAITVAQAGQPAAPDLGAELAALKKARRTGTRRVKIENFETEYRDDAELARAIASLEAEIAAAQGSPPIRNVNVRSKGWSQ